MELRNRLFNFVSSVRLMKTPGSFIIFNNKYLSLGDLVATSFYLLWFYTSECLELYFGSVLPIL